MTELHRYNQPSGLDSLNPIANLVARLVCCWCLLIGIVAWSSPVAFPDPPQQGAETTPTEILPPAGIEHPPALAPEEAVQQFTVAEGLAISLVVAEPDVAQPLSISFDERGRMWVLQYRQYPNPKGLSAVQMDNWLRTKYDKVPEPPPDGPRGQDQISIYEDRDGDGRTEKVADFVSDLNLASGMALGYDGVYVVQPPYLLFYADRDHDDAPDGPPEVLLKGFGMEDAHAFANSLTWGPDGWLYGCQGSTATANIRGIGFQQGLWRYHPRTKEFELFSEGGGNSWGVEFDARGNVFTAGNTVEPLVHHVQGGYYVKGFGKHGPLHNPHAYGYFQPVLHHGYVGDSLTGGAILYQGGVFPSQFNGACIAPNTRHSACRWSTVESRGSTIATRHAGDFVTSKDIWFRPVDMTVGPDGAVYIADWYDYNISHSNPLNRSQWYQPSRLDGRIWRVAPLEVKPIPAGSFDLSKQSNKELVKLLSHTNDWYVRQARRIFAERRDPEVIAELSNTARHATDERAALRALWAVDVCGGLDAALALDLLESPHEYVRAWVIRLIGDQRQFSSEVHTKCLDLAKGDPSVIVRSQLACTAKRIPAEQMLPIVSRLLERDVDANDPFVPLLLWWAIEDKAISASQLVLSPFEIPEFWRRPLVERTIVERLVRRFTAEGTEESFESSAKLLALAPTTVDRDRVVSGMLQSLSGRRLEEVPQHLSEPVAKLLSDPRAPFPIVELALRVNIPAATERGLKIVENALTTVDARTAIIRTFGETRNNGVVGDLLSLLRREEPDAVQSAILSALASYDDDRVAETTLERYAALTGGAQSRAIELLVSRAGWANRLVDAVDRQTIPATAVSLEQVRQMRERADELLEPLLTKHWGRVQTTTPLEMLGRVTAVSQLLNRGRGDAAAGKIHFDKVCANCHKLHGQGNTVGPDLTGAERKNRDLLVKNIVDPSSVIREQYIMHVVAMQDGRVLNGLLAESAPDTITLLDAKNKRTILNRSEIDELKESTKSQMPENLLDPLTEKQIRNLFAYLQTEVPIP